MSTFDIYVHGTPRGHQICGSEHSHDYINTFYNHDSQASEKVVLQIEVCGGDSFYTYIHHQNVYDFEGRPQAFFALTVGFRKTYCTNVYRLYQLFDAVYNQICVGSILKQSGNGESYLVSDMRAARSGANATVDKIQAAFNQKIAELIVPTLQPLSSGDTFNKSKKVVSLLEVDSPLFFDYSKKYSLIVSPNMQPSAYAYDAVSNELRQVSAQKKALSTLNDQLQSDLAALTQENKSLSNQLHASASSTEKKFKSRLEQLQNDLSSVTSERNSLKQKIQEATNSIELIDQPFQKLTRLLAGRFPENRSQRRNDYLDEKKEVNKKSQNPIWRNWLNSILLGLILVCCVVTLALVLKDKNTANDSQISNESITGTKVEEPVASVVKNEDEYSGDDPGSSGTEVEYDDWNKCFPNIVDGGKQLKLNKRYTLFVAKNGTNSKALVPDGNWEVFINQGQMLNTGDSFILTDASTIGKNVMIQYVVNNQPVLSRLCKIIP